jgi:hypothetical protein
VTRFCKCGDESSGSCATELVRLHKWPVLCSQHICIACSAYPILNNRLYKTRLLSKGISMKGCKQEHWVVIKFNFCLLSFITYISPPQTKQYIWSFFKCIYFKVLPLAKRTGNRSATRHRMVLSKLEQAVGHLISYLGAYWSLGCWQILNFTEGCTMLNKVRKLSRMMSKCGFGRRLLLLSVWPLRDFLQSAYTKLG